MWGRPGDSLELQIGAGAAEGTLTRVRAGHRQVIGTVDAATGEATWNPHGLEAGSSQMSAWESWIYGRIGEWRRAGGPA